MGAFEEDLGGAAAAKRFVEKLMITGTLWCFDQAQNIILLNCHETKTSAQGTEQRRPLGPLVMVPGKHITKIEALKVRAALARGRALAEMKQERQRQALLQ